MVRVRFELDSPGAKAVYLAGDFNEWNPTARRMKRVHKDTDTFVAQVNLSPGRHEFRYVVDGKWVCCPTSPRVPNTMGTENSVVEVGA
jgi:1,4-alpha-glucan branching enzyme